MINSFVAEMDKSVRRPATWVLVAVWAIAGVAYVYIIPYISYASPTSKISAATRQALLTDLLPEHLITSVIAGFPLFGGMVVLIFGAFVVGSEYGWGTLKTVFVQRPGRLDVLSGKLLALAVMQVAFVLAVFVPGAVSSFIVALVVHAPVNWPSAWDFAQAFGASWLILTMWATLGAMLATALRGATLAVGPSLFYLIFERVIAGFANLSSCWPIYRRCCPDRTQVLWPPPWPHLPPHRALRQWWEPHRPCSSSLCTWEALSCSASCSCSSATCCEGNPGSSKRYLDRALPQLIGEFDGLKSEKRWREP